MMTGKEFQQGSLFSGLGTGSERPLSEQRVPSSEMVAREQSQTEPLPSSSPSVSEESAVTIRFLPNDITVEATPGESLLQVAHNAGVDIPTGCLRGSCHACEVETNVWGAVCSCIAAVPEREMVPDGVMVVELWSDPTW